LMKLLPTETLLTGAWALHGDRVIADATCERINQLARSHLKLLGRDWSGWETLYLDPDDGRLWEQTYPQGEMHGGGPPQLRCVGREEAKAKYGNTVVVN
jgi:hypothetical protein